MNNIEKCKNCKNEIVIIFVLTIITALEPLSIDTYISSFMDIAKSLKTSVLNVQITLSVFLGGFAVGQLFWGVVSDAVGRRKPILFSLLAFTVATFMCMSAPTVEFMWVARFFQAFFGCALAGLLPYAIRLGERRGLPQNRRRADLLFFLILLFFCLHLSENR